MRFRKTKVATLKLTEGEEKAINALVAAGKFKSKGDVLRQGFYVLLEKYMWLDDVRRQIVSERSVRPPRQGKVVRTPLDAMPGQSAPPIAW